MNARSLLFAFVLFATSVCVSVSCAQEPKVSPLIVGQSVVFQSSILDEERKLNVYLPHSYSKNTAHKYPVIYLLDGSLDEDFVHIAGLTQFGSFSWIEMLPEAIVVGLANVDRKRDFTSPPTDEKDKLEFPTAGGSGKFMKMLSQEVQPLIQKLYRVNGKRTIIGQSLGGLLATEILLKRPELFDNYIIISPGLWWDNRSLLELKLPEFQKPHSVFVGVGKEGDVMEQLAKELFSKLEKNRSDRFQVHFQHFPKLDHGDTLHLAVYAAFEKLFSQK